MWIGTEGERGLREGGRMNRGGIDPAKQIAIARAHRALPRPAHEAEGVDSTGVL